MAFAQELHFWLILAKNSEIKAISRFYWVGKFTMFSFLIWKFLGFQGKLACYIWLCFLFLFFHHFSYDSVYSHSNTLQSSLQAALGKNTVSQGIVD